MKTKIFYACLLAAGSLFTSCSDFLDKTPYDTVDANIAINDSVAMAMTNACYRTLQSSNMYNQRLWTLDIVAGNSIVGAGGGTDGLETVQAANFTTMSDNGMALYMWRSPWVGIGQCNTTIQSMNNAHGMSEAVRNQCMGEALFLRAHYYYVLVRLYGNLPLRTEPYDPSTSPDIARVDKSQIYNVIIDDCNKAIELLPTKSHYDSDNVGRACKEAAMAMLADVYLTLAPQNNKYYENVVTLCKQIEDLGYSLDGCAYEDNFGEKANNGPESLFEVQYSGNTEYDFWGNNPQSSWLSTFMGPRNSDFVAGSYGWNQPTQEFVNQYEDGDSRKDVTIFYEGCPAFDGKEYKSSYSNTGYNVRKFLVRKSFSPEYNTNPANFVVYRYADVLLKRAEALNELDRTPEAYEFINAVRKRANLPSLHSLSKEEMREKIIHERRIELAFEGHRWFDMIRLDGGQYAVNFLHSIGKSNANINRLLFPIPQTEIDANALMDQNFGY